MDSSMLVLLLPSLLVCIITTALIFMRVLSQKSTYKLPPGPRGLPLIGHLHLLGKLPHHSLCQLSKLHGPLMSLRFGSVPVVVASSPEMARQILQTHDLAFANRAPPIAGTNILGWRKDIVFSQPNSYWKHLRLLCATDLFSTKRTRFFKPVREDEIRVLMRSVMADIDASDKLEDAGAAAAPPQIEMRPKLRQASNNIIMRMMLGNRFSELQPPSGVKERPKESIVELLAKMSELVGQPNVGDFLPSLAWMDLQGIGRRSKKVGADLREAFDWVIQGRRLANTDGRPPADFLDLLLQVSDTPIHIMEILLDLFTAGTDTTAALIEWALIELLSNLEKMKIVQAEIDEVVGRERLIEEDDIEQLPFLVACVKETMRLHPALPMLIPHTNIEPCKIMDFYIPANTQAYVNVWAIGRDPKVWENPTKFLPERFLKANPADVQGQFFELLPFGSGRRMCPAWKLGLQSVQIILAALLQGFEWSSPPSYHIDLSETFQLTSTLTNPLVSYATPRLSKTLY